MPSPTSAGHRTWSLHTHAAKVIVMMVVVVVVVKMVKMMKMMKMMKMVERRSLVVSHSSAHRHQIERRRLGSAGGGGDSGVRAYECIR